MTKTVNPSSTASPTRSATVSMTSFVSRPSGSSSEATHWETKAPRRKRMCVVVLTSCALICAPRVSRSVHTTLAIMKRVNHAAPRWDPKNREPRPGRGRRLTDPDDDERDDGREAEQREEVLDEPEDRPVADDGDLEGRVDERAEGLEDREEEDTEAPEHGGMGRARRRPPQQPPLGRDLGQLRADGRADTPAPPRLDGLARPAQPVEEEEPAPGDAEQHDRHEHSDDESDDHSYLPGDGRVCRGPRRGPRSGGRSSHPLR